MRFPRGILTNVLYAVLVTTSELHVQHILVSWIAVSSDVKPHMQSCSRTQFSCGWSTEKILLHSVVLKASDLVKNNMKINTNTYIAYTECHGLEISTRASLSASPGIPGATGDWFSWQRFFFFLSLFTQILVRHLLSTAHDYPNNDVVFITFACAEVPFSRTHA